MRQAWPVVLAQAATALTGVVDTVVMGFTGDGADLAAIAIASVTFSFVYWGFGFLRMATTGQAAQAIGAGAPERAAGVLGRALALGLVFGVSLWVLFPVIRVVALGLFSAAADVESRAAAYYLARIGGAPFALMGYALNGYLLGTGRTRALLGYQLVLNGTNAILDAIFVTQFGWGPAGIGAGTAMAEVIALVVALGWIRRDLPVAWSRLRSSDDEPHAWSSLLATNRDIAVRTLAMLSAFGWFSNAGALLGTAVLAANQVLLQFVAVSAHVLDGVAFIAEKETGEAMGAGSRQRLAEAIARTSEVAVVMGVVFSLGIALLGRPLLRWFVMDPEVLQIASDHLWYCAAVPLLGVAAWQLDGIFLGATRGRALRNAALITTALYIALDLVLRPAFGNAGAWIALLTSYVLRAATLAVALPALFRAVTPTPEPPSHSQR
ncbi:MAG: MATE family efflux transporter [Myxococcota bacterium]